MSEMDTGALGGPLPFATGQIQIKHHNPDAPSGQPLVLPVQMVCNTDDDTRHRNIRRNSAGREWLLKAEAHERVAVICGSGPSIKDHRPELAALYSWPTNDFFALNQAAKWLADEMFVAQYQVMVDARPGMVDLLGPVKEKYLFASQCNPLLFQMKPDAQLFHLYMDGIQDILNALKPDPNDPYTIVGSGPSVGLCAMFLAYTMGYRKIKCFGFDSSHPAGESHVIEQRMNDSEPTAMVMWNGNEYRTTLVMKNQAEKFGVCKKALNDLGCEVEVIGDGLLPDMVNTTIEQLSEQAKYEKLWSEIPNYRRHSPGEMVAPLANKLLLEHCDGLQTVIDFGCGTGRGAKAMAEMGWSPFLCDFADNCRDKGLELFPFFPVDLTKAPPPFQAKCGMCCDVMEHIQPEDVPTVICNIMQACETCFFQISTVNDVFGSAIGQTLHVCVRQHSWWFAMFESLGFDVVWEEDQQANSLFLVKRRKGVI